MKKLICIFFIGVVITSCSKKITPTTSQTSSSNNGGMATGNNSGVPQGNTQPTIAVSSPSVATTANASAAEASKPTRATGELTIEQKGQATFNAKCGSCHGFKVTTDYTANRWITVMQVMAVKANLSDVEKENVLAYVKANAKK